MLVQLLKSDFSETGGRGGVHDYLVNDIWHVGSPIKTYFGASCGALLWAKSDVSYFIISELACEQSNEDCCPFNLWSIESLMHTRHAKRRDQANRITCIDLNKICQNVVGCICLYNATQWDLFHSRVILIKQKVWLNLKCVWINTESFTSMDIELNSKQVESLT